MTQIMVRTEKTDVVHKIDMRLRNNAGMDFPSCYANTLTLDLNKSRLPLTNKNSEVTCKCCKRLLGTMWK